MFSFRSTIYIFSNVSLSVKTAWLVILIQCRRTEGAGAPSVLLLLGNKEDEIGKSEVSLGKPGKSAQSACLFAFCVFCAPTAGAAGGAVPAAAGFALLLVPPQNKCGPGSQEADPHQYQYRTHIFTLLSCVLFMPSPQRYSSAWSPPYRAGRAYTAGRPAGPRRRLGPRSARRR